MYVQASVEKLAPGGEGLALCDGKRVFIPLSAPGDLVRAKITEDHGAWARAELVEIIEASPDRIEPRCPRYGECGGCSLQHLSYNVQLEVKREILTDALIRTGGAASAPPITVIPSEPWEYRNRISLHAARSNRFPRCGLMARKSETVIPLDDCPATVPGIRQVLPRLLPPPGKDRFTLYSRGDTLLAENGTSLGNGGALPSRGRITLLDREITLEAASFFQSNAGAMEALIRQLRNIAEQAVGQGCSGNPETRTMADLYAGVGTFSLFLSDLFPGGMDLMEADSRALSLARINLDSTRRGLWFFPQQNEQRVKKRHQ
jgi:23S rRNA (uracil1939-C5)-methyltransferase